MNGARQHITQEFARRCLRNVGNARICSFQEFAPFCHALYFISNYKDFNTQLPDLH